ncbi:transposase, partial [Massilimicrobiota sp. An80]
MAMTCLNNRKNDSFILSTIDELVPSDHKVRELEEAIDWTFIYPLVRPLYSSFGRPSIDPVVLFKMLFINFTFGIHSMRRTCEEIKVNLAYRWFLGLSIDDEVPNYSTWSQNYIRRYGDSEIFDEIFNRIIEEAIAYDFVDLDTVFGDGTHRKANANSRKHENKVVEIVKKHYDDELLEEINKDREEHGKKALKETKDIELAYDEETGELIEGKGTKSIKVSKTDPESGCFHKGEKQKCFAYTNLTFCDRHGFVLHNTVAPGNQHDSV